jgi:beta-glucosidase
MLGRGGDRQSLELSAHDELLIRLVGTTNRRTVVVVEAGSAVIMERWKKEVSSILLAFYAGMEGGTALADILFGAVSPSGKLPFAIPAVADQLPFFDSKAPRIRYDRFHGYRLLDRRGVEPAFAFGFGLSYTRFAYGKPGAAARSVEGETVDVTVPVTNTGTAAAEEVVQAYVKRPESVPNAPQKELVAFARVHLEPDESRHVPLSIRTRDLQWYAEETSEWVLEPGSYEILVGPSSRARDLRAVELVVRKETPWRNT